MSIELAEWEAVLSSKQREVMKDGEVILHGVMHLCPFDKKRWARIEGEDILYHMDAAFVTRHLGSKQAEKLWKLPISTHLVVGGQITPVYEAYIVNNLALYSSFYLDDFQEAGSDVGRPASLITGHEDAFAMATANFNAAYCTNCGTPTNTIVSGPNKSHYCPNCTQ